MQNDPFQLSDNLLPFDGKAYLYDSFFTAQEADHFYEDLAKNIPWRQEPIKIFGKVVMQPRLTAFYGDAGKPYRYSGIEMIPIEWNGVLLAIKNRVEKMAGTVFSSALLNYYRNGHDSMGWHRDNEKSLGYQPVIASASFGAGRTFRFRYYKDKKLVQAVELGHGSLLLMMGDTQHFWEHCLPKSARAAEPRINVTFRAVN